MTNLEKCGGNLEKAAGVYNGTTMEPTTVGFAEWCGSAATDGGEEKDESVLMRLFKVFFCIHVIKAGTPDEVEEKLHGLASCAMKNVLDVLYSSYSEKTINANMNEVYGKEGMKVKIHKYEDGGYSVLAEVVKHE